MQRSRIAIVEDDPAMQARLVDTLRTQPDFEVVGAYATRAAALEAIDRLPIDVLIVDLGLPDGDGTQVIARCAERQPGCEIVVVTIFSDDERVMRSLAAGATGYLLKDDPPDDIVQSIRLVRSGGSPVSPSVARRLLARFRSPQASTPSPAQTGAPRGPGDARGQDAVDPKRSGNGASASRGAAAPRAPGPEEALSRREIEILELVAKGCSVAEIGQLLHLSAHTVGTHVKNIYRKLAVHSRMEAVYEARTLGLIRD